MITNVCRRLLVRNPTRIFKNVPVNNQTVFPNRAFRTTATIFQKIYRDLENSYLHGLLPQTHPPPSLPVDAPKPPRAAQVDNLFDFNRTLNHLWRSANMDSIVDAFDSVTSFCVKNDIAVSDTRFDLLVDGFLDHVEDLTDGQLYRMFEIIMRFPPTEAPDSHNFHDLWSALDDVCYTKMRSWDTDRMFSFGDMWFRLSLAKKSDYVFEMVEKLAKKPEQLSKSQLIRLFFMFNVCRRKEVPFDVEYELVSKISEMNIDEMAVVALGYFKTKTKIKSEAIIDEMAKRIVEQAPFAHEMSLTALLKVIRFSDRTHSATYLPLIIRSLGPQINRLSNLCCLHIALLGTNLQVYDEEVVDKIAKKMHKSLADPEKIRLKDIERILFVLTMFNVRPKTPTDFFEDCVRELERKERRKEAVRYPRCLVSALNYLSIVNIYPYELLNYALDPQVIRETYGNAKTVPRELLSLDASVEIECPDYGGNKLHFVNRCKATKWLVEHVPRYDQPRKLSAADMLILEVIQTAEKIAGKSNVFVGHVLPHFSKADVLVCWNRKTSSYVEPICARNYMLGKVLKPVIDDDLLWYSIVIVGWNTTVRGASVPLGAMNMKARQLRALGYRPAFVFWNEFGELSSDNKLRYVREKLAAAF